jgi:hypothetical protein
MTGPAGPGDPGAGPEAAYQRYLQAQAEADKAVQACGGVTEFGTPEGDKAYDLNLAADAAYERYVDAWHDARQDGPQAGREPEAEPW